jgi:hypothetical protein
MTTPVLIGTSRNLAGHVGEGNEDRTENGHQPRGLRVIAVADEIRHGELAELAQVGREQERQQHVAAGPADQIHGARVAHERDHAGHGNERRRTHPVRAGCHAVEDGGHALAGHVKALGARHPRVNRDADVNREGDPDDDEGPATDVHYSCSSSTSYLRSSFFMISTYVMISTMKT